MSTIRLLIYYLVCIFFTYIDYLYLSQLRARKKRVNFNRFMNNHSKMVLSHKIMQSFEEGASTPHVLVELSKKELSRLTPNSISLKGVSSCKNSGKLLYESVKYGTNIRKRKSSITFNGNKIPSY